MKPPSTIIHMGASAFTIDSTFDGNTAHMDLRRAPQATLTTVGKQLCKLHEVKATAKKTKPTARSSTLKRQPRMHLVAPPSATQAMIGM